MFLKTNYKSKDTEFGAVEIRWLRQVCSISIYFLTHPNLDCSINSTDHFLAVGVEAAKIAGDVDRRLIDYLFFNFNFVLSF